MVKKYRWNISLGVERGYWQLIFTYKRIPDFKIKEVMALHPEVQMDFYMYETKFGNIYTSHTFIFDI